MNISVVPSLEASGDQHSPILLRRLPPPGQLQLNRSIEAPPAELDTLCLEHIARFKRPKDYRFIEALPKNNYGKVLKTELREIDAKQEESE